MSGCGACGDTIPCHADQSFRLKGLSPLTIASDVCKPRKRTLAFVCSRKSVLTLSKDDSSEVTIL